MFCDFTWLFVPSVIFRGFLWFYVVFRSKRGFPWFYVFLKFSVVFRNKPGLRWFAFVFYVLSEVFCGGMWSSTVFRILQWISLILHGSWKVFRHL